MHWVTNSITKIYNQSFKENRIKNCRCVSYANIIYSVDERYKISSAILWKKKSSIAVYHRFYA